MSESETKEQVQLIQEHAKVLGIGMRLGAIDHLMKVEVPVELRVVTFATACAEELGTAFAFLGGELEEKIERFTTLIRLSHDLSVKLRDQMVAEIKETLP